MLNRRTFLAATGAGLLGTALSRAEDVKPARKKLAVVTTLWNYRSHAWHMAERFLHGYPVQGRWHRPAIDVVSAYVDQRPEGDLSGQRAKEFGFTIYPTIAETLRCGGDKLAVDGVLVIGEHGDYPLSETGAKQYPRYQFFKQITDVFAKDGRVTPVFNDKHLSWKFEWAKEMVELSKSMKFPFLAGSSLPVTWRMPAIDLPYGAEVEEMLCIAFGAVDIYDFHALETMQCMAERRKGGETGVVAMHALRGDAVWKALDAGSWVAGGWSPQLFEACLSRSHTLAQPETFSHRYPTRAQMQEWVKEPIAYRFEYADGTKATMLLMNGAENMFMTGRASYPVERTMLTSGLVEAGLKSLATGQKRLETPHLKVQYTAPRESTFFRE